MPKNAPDKKICSHINTAPASKKNLTCWNLTAVVIKIWPRIRDSTNMLQVAPKSAHNYGCKQSAPIFAHFLHNNFSDHDKIKKKNPSAINCSVYSLQKLFISTKCGICKFSHLKLSTFFAIAFQFQNYYVCVQLWIKTYFCRWYKGKLAKAAGALATLSGHFQNFFYTMSLQSKNFVWKLIIIGEKMLSTSIQRVQACNFASEESHAYKSIVFKSL